MTTADSTHGTPLARTPLYALHRELGAKMVPFGGWEMPLQYAGIVAEHRAVRERVGLFDVSHMGEIRFTGPRAREAVQRLVTNNVGKLVDGQALYTFSCNEAGGVVDDCVVYREGPERFLIVVNAANIAKDFAHFTKYAGELCTIDDDSAATALLALQGPAALALLERGFRGAPLASLKPFTVASGTAFGVAAIASRTGYTGEDGFEIFCAAGDATSLARALLDAGQDAGIQPAGLGARDTLRLEARLCLYGQDLSETTSPLEAQLGWVVKLDEVDFIGKEALVRQKAAGVARKLVGLRALDRGIPRHDYPIHAATSGAAGSAPGALVGTVTSGTKTPTLDIGIAMGYVATASAEPGTRLLVDCRGKMQPVEVVKGPFYRRAK